jgi:FKBP-type peptidyl-prolyl cis-trans isomerase (trigger factor)
VKIDLFPYVKVGKLKAAQMTRHFPHRSTKADIDAEIKDRLVRYAEYPESDAATAFTEKNDKLTVDFEIWVDDAPSGEVNKDFVFDLGSGTLSRELEQQIAERKGKVGEEFKLKKDIQAQQDGAAAQL